MQTVEFNPVRGCDPHIIRFRRFWHGAKRPASTDGYYYDAPPALVFFKFFK